MSDASTTPPPAATPRDDELQQALTDMATELQVPGVSVGVIADGEERYAFHGVTSVENPLTVDETTLFQFGSTGKTYTATAMMRLVEKGQVDLDAPVRTYVPELTLKDEDAASKVTVLQLFNHTAGWTGDRIDSTGDGDDALARYVELMATFDQVSPLGAEVSYNNASLALAGRIIEKVTGSTFEQAIRDLLLTPLGMDHTFFFPNEVMTRRFAVGHTRHDDGRITINRPWAMPRSMAPAGGMSANASDQLRWARFHLGGGQSGVLSDDLRLRMQEPTADMAGSALGDAVGISWLLRDVDGARLVGHGGTTNGQYSDFVLLPDRGFAFTSMSNCGPNGSELNHRLMVWALEHYAGIVDSPPEPVLLGDDALSVYVGRYETVAAVVEITANAGRLLADITTKPEMEAALREAGDEVPPKSPPFVFAMLPDGDRYVVHEGPAKGMKGYFRRDADGRVDGAHIGGRMATRVRA